MMGILNKDCHESRSIIEEERNWGVKVEDIQKRIDNSTQVGIEVRAIVVINPGNPTGNVLKRSDIEDIIHLSYENGLVILADEVY